MAAAYLPIVLALVELVAADYTCTCTYAVETTVYYSPDISSQSSENMYEFDCRENLVDKNVPGWKAVAINHHVGYVMDSNTTQTTNCMGSPSTTDILVTVSVVAHSAAVSTSTVGPSPKSPTPGILTRTAAPVTFGMPDTTTQMMTPAPTTAAPAPTTAAPVPTTAAAATEVPITPAVVTAAPSTARPIVQGHTELCPASVTSSRHSSAQFNHSCYILVEQKTDWQAAEDHCDIYNGGHLFHVSNAEEQQFIVDFLRRSNFNHEVWMGLYDKVHEEDFRWVSGNPVTYTNWYPLRLDDVDGHSVEDCAVLNPSPPFNGQWDDLHCGVRGIFGHLLSPGHDHAYICQTSIDLTNPSHLHGGILDLIGSVIG